MLQLFRKKKEWLKWVLILVIIGLGFTTVLLFVRTPTTGIMGGVGVREVAKIAGHPITAAQFRRYYQKVFEYYRKTYNLDKQDPEVVKQLGLGQMALNQIVNQYAIANEARARGLTVTNEELIDQISRLPAFQDNGRFIGSQRYRQILQYSGMTTSEFEESMRRDILLEKFRNIITDGVEATAAEVRQDFMEANSTVKLEYVVFDPEKLKVEAASEEVLKTYYEENQDNFRVPEKRKIQYTIVFVTPDEVDVSPEQVDAELPSVTAEEQVRARHILIDLEAGEDAARREAMRIVKELRQGGDFAALARQYSVDQMSALRGGDLGFFARGRMVPEFEVVAFSQKPGQISDPVRTPFGYHIIQTVSKVSANEESRRPVAKYLAQVKEAEKRSADLADQLVQTVRGGESLSEAAAAQSLGVEETGYFDNASGIPSLAVGNDFLQEVFSLSTGDLTKPYPASGSYVVAQLEDVKPALLPDLEEVHQEVAQDYLENQRENLAQEQAAEFRVEALEAESFSSAAKKRRLKVTTTDFFKKDSNIDETLKFSPKVHEEAFALDVNGVSTPILVAGKYILFRVVEHGGIDETKFEEEKTQIYDRLTEEKRNEFFSAYVTNVLADLRRNNGIAINQELVDRITGS